MTQKIWLKEFNKFEKYEAVFNEKENRLGLEGRAHRHFFLYGEKNSGKELFAEMVHQASSLCNNPFVDVYINEHDDIDFFQQKFFGYFDANEEFFPGLVEKAKGGTLYLNGFQYLSNELLIEIIMSVEKQTYSPVSSNIQRNSDIRLILATNQKDYDHHQELLPHLVFSNNFLSHPIKMLPLQQRSNEIQGIVEYFLERISLDTDKKKMEPAEDCIGCLENYNWPGNVPELIEEIETAVDNVQIDTVLRSIHLSKKVRFAPPKRQPEKDKAVIESGNKYNRRIELDDLSTYLYFYRDKDDGDFWQVGEVGNSRTIKHISGMAFINFLLMYPNQPINAYTVYHLGKILPEGTVEYGHNPESNRKNKFQIKVREETKGYSLEKLDQFIENYKKKLKAFGFNERGDRQLTPEEFLEKKEDNRRKIKDTLKELIQIKTDRINKRKGRKTSDEIDPLIVKSRPAVTNRIRDALDRIHEKLPEMKTFLNKETISTGYNCSYNESEINKVHWILSDEQAKEFKIKFDL